LDTKTIAGNSHFRNIVGQEPTLERAGVHLPSVGIHRLSAVACLFAVAFQGVRAVIYIIKRTVL